MFLGFLLNACQNSTEQISLKEGSLSESSVTILHKHSCTTNSDTPRYSQTSLGPQWDNQTEGERSNYWGWGIAIQDFNNDGYWDIVLPHFLEADQIFFGNASAEVEASVLPWKTNEFSNKYSYGVTSEDIDNDGDVDILIAGDPHNYIYINHAGTFQMLVEDEFSTSLPTRENKQTHHLAVAYVDDDHYPDIFGPTYYTSTEISDADPLVPRNLLYWGSDFLFWEQEINWDGDLEISPANAGGWLDIDDDGDLDLFVANDKPQVGFRSGVLLNQGDRNLEYFFGNGLDFAVQGMGLAWGDLNLDGLIDIGVTGWGDFALGIGESSGYWYEAAQAWGLESSENHVVGWGIEFVDLDNDGDQDVLVANGAKYNDFGELGGDPLYDPFVNSEEQYFSVYVNNNGHLEFQSNQQWAIGSAGNYRGFAMVDWNKDGYLDIFARDLGRKAKFFQSNCQENKSLIIFLRQEGYNSSAVGARIWVNSSSLKRQFRDIQVGSTNIASSSPPMAHFGVSKEDRVSIKIRWPDGTMQSLNNIATGQTIQIDKITQESPQ